jgi:hypothetical protein
MKKMGRPTKFSQPLANEICAQLAKGISMRTVCKAEKMPDVSTIFDWIHKYDDFAKQYARAKEESADALFEETIDIADDARDVIIGGEDRSDNARVQVERLRVDTRKWMMSKMKPKKYSDHLDLTTNGKDFPSPIYNGASNNKKV